MEIFVNDLDRHCTSFIIDAFCSCYIVYISDSLAAAVHVAAVPAVPCPSRFALAVFQFSGSIPRVLPRKLMQRHSCSNNVLCKKLACETSATVCIRCQISFCLGAICLFSCQARRSYQERNRITMSESDAFFQVKTPKKFSNDISLLENLEHILTFHQK